MGEAMHNLQPPVVFGGADSKPLAEAICHYLDIPMGHANTNPFPNGETQIRIEDNVRNRDVFVVLSTCRPDVNDKYMELFLMGDALNRASAGRITAVIPYFGYARQDRKAAGRTPISARVMCDMIETAGYNRVLTIDLHADQIQGFFSQNVLLDHLNTGDLFANHVRSLVDAGLKNLIVVSPDIGNMKKVDKYRQGFPEGIGVAVIDKRRDPVSGKSVAVGIVGDVKDKNIIMCDDIMATCGTMRRAMDYCIENGAASGDDQGFYLLATHGEFVGNALENLNHPKIKLICVTDTMPALSMCSHAVDLTSKVEVLSVAPLLAKAIRRIHDGQSISELLGKFS